LEGVHTGKHYQVPVPSCWETYPGFENYRGTADYETTFEASGDIRLEFKGVSHMGRVFLDGKEVGSHYNAYTPFEIIVKDLAEGTHVLTVNVDNSFKKEYGLNRPNDYMSYGGISRAVLLESIPEVYISNVHVTPILTEEKWQAKVEIYCHNIGQDEKEITLDFKLHHTEYQSEVICASAGVSKVLDVILDFEDVEPWSLENPKLYEMTAILSMKGQQVDDYIDRTGFRIVSIKENRILFNGKPLRIKGFCRHEDHPHYGNALPFQAMTYDLNLMKDMGANSVRTAHYPNDELFLDLCDELGILVWEENHVRSASEEFMKNPYFEIQAEQVIEEMISKHYNHPSIYIWGIMNECASETEFGRECYVKQYDLIRSLDQSRPCSSASCKYEKDLCMDLPDVCSWNMYPYWYEDKTASQMVDEVYQWTQVNGGKGKPFMVTEVGAGAIYGYRSPEHDKWTEEFQAEALEKQLTEIMEYEDCMGIYIWQFCDIRVSREWFANRPRTKNNKGIVDELRRPKLSYGVVKKLFTDCPGYW